MKLLRSAISLIYKNTRNELHPLQQNRLFCTIKTGNHEIKSNENKIDDKNISPTSETNDDGKVANNKRKPVDKEDANLSYVKKGILITSYSTVSIIESSVILFISCFFSSSLAFLSVFVHFRLVSD